MNIIALIGLYEFLFVIGDDYFRVHSIMRLPTRLGPFLAVFVAMAVTGLIEAKTNKDRVYWTLTLILNVFIALATQTRTVLITLITLAIFIGISLKTTGYQRWFSQYIKGVAVTVGVLFIMTITGKVDFLTRFTDDAIEVGSTYRSLIVLDFWESAGLENATPQATWAHHLFGYGIFRERSMANLNLHDSFLNTYSAFGILGGTLYILPYLLVVLGCLWGMFFATKKSARPAYAATAAIMVGFVISGLFHNRIYSPLDTAFCWLVAGVILRKELPSFFNWQLGESNVTRKLFQTNAQEEINEQMA